MGRPFDGDLRAIIGRKRKRDDPADIRTQIRHGVVVAFLADRDYGFISDGRPWVPDVFFHASACSFPPHICHPGMKVVYRHVQKHDRAFATDVTQWL